jgi:hypothetical protein
MADNQFPFLEGLQRSPHGISRNTMTRAKFTLRREPVSFPPVLGTYFLLKKDAQTSGISPFSRPRTPCQYSPALRLAHEHIPSKISDILTWRSFAVYTDLV